MTCLTRAELCVELSISDRQLTRMLQDGMPFVPVGRRGKRFDPTVSKNWLKEVYSCPFTATPRKVSRSTSAKAGDAFTAACRLVQLRVKPNS
jgi:hypothetical protein